MNSGGWMRFSYCAYMGKTFWGQMGFPYCAHMGKSELLGSDGFLIVLTWVKVSFWAQMGLPSRGVSVLCRSRDSDLSSIISNLHQSRQLVMPESQSRCEFKRSSLDVGLAAAGEAGPAPCALGLCLPCSSSPSSSSPSSPFHPHPIHSLSSCFFCVTLEL